MAEYNFEKVTAGELKEILVNTILKNNLSMLILGRTGIGKSQIVEESAREYAEKIGKIFVNWREASEELKNKVLENPEKYYVLITYPMSLTDIGEFKIPFVKDNQTFRYLVNDEIYIFTKTEGVLFLDEVNLVQNKSLLNMLYQLVLNRAIGSVKLKCAVIGAGNVAEDKADVSRMPSPLLRRFIARAELMFDEDEFLKYMIDRKFDERVILFLQYNKQLMYQIDVNTGSSFSIPAVWEQFSNLIKGESDEEAMKLAGLILGPSAGAEFKSFIKLVSEIDIDKLIKNPSEINKFDRTRKMASILVLSRNINKDNVGRVARGLMEIKEDELIIMLLCTLKLINDKMKDRLIEELNKVDSNRLAKICKELVEIASV